MTHQPYVCHDPQFYRKPPLLGLRSFLKDRRGSFLVGQEEVVALSPGSASGRDEVLALRHEVGQDVTFCILEYCTHRHLGSEGKTIKFVYLLLKVA